MYEHAQLCKPRGQMCQDVYLDRNTTSYFSSNSGNIETAKLPRTNSSPGLQKRSLNHLI